MHTDPVADMLTRIRNASRAKRKSVIIPRSKLKLQLAEILKQEGFVGEFRELLGGEHGHPVIEMDLRYDGGTPVISGISRVSKPGLRKYKGCQDIARVKRGLGIMVLTTSRGVMSDREARRQKVGGEVLCTVW